MKGSVLPLRVQPSLDIGSRTTYTLLVYVLFESINSTIAFLLSCLSNINRAQAWLRQEHKEIIHSYIKQTVTKSAILWKKCVCSNRKTHIMTLFSCNVFSKIQKKYILFTSVKFGQWITLSVYYKLQFNLQNFLFIISQHHLNARYNVPSLVSRWGFIIRPGAFQNLLHFPKTNQIKPLSKQTFSPGWCKISLQTIFVFQVSVHLSPSFHICPSIISVGKIV